MHSSSTPRNADGRSFNEEFINSLTSVRCVSELLVVYPGLEAGDRGRFLAILSEETERLVRLAVRNGLRGGCTDSR